MAVARAGLTGAHPDLHDRVIARQGCDGPFEARYGATPDRFTLARPDQDVVRSWPVLDCEAAARSRAKALAQE